MKYYDHKFHNMTPTKFRSLYTLYTTDDFTISQRTDGTLRLAVTGDNTSKNFGYTLAFPNQVFVPNEYGHIMTRLQIAMSLALSGTASDGDGEGFTIDFASSDYTNHARLSAYFPNGTSTYTWRASYITYSSSIFKPHIASYTYVMDGYCTKGGLPIDPFVLNIPIKYSYDNANDVTAVDFGFSGSSITMPTSLVTNNKATGSQYYSMPSIRINGRFKSCSGTLDLGRVEAGAF